MTVKTIALGADHGGYAEKEKLRRYLREAGFRVMDIGAFDSAPSDYPVYGFRVAEAVARGQAGLGILLCKSGNGMAMAANRVPGVRAALASDIELARLAREHNNANVLVLGAEHMNGQSMESVVDAFIKSSQAGTPDNARHVRRVRLIEQYEKLHDSALPTHQLAAYGQSPWIDDISDEMIASGTLKRLVEVEGVRGLTSNPTIFEKAISAGKGRYPAELARMAKIGSSAEEAYETLTNQDIAAAADILRPLYDQTGGDDGFVSLEVLPAYADDEEKSVQEAMRLFKLLNRPNLMIKVPGTAAGICAFRRLTAAGVNVNVTLIFSRGGYNDIARAYIAGLKDRLSAKGNITDIRSVASVFVSRIDTAVDKRLSALISSESDLNKSDELKSLLHKIAIDNTRLIYDDFRKIFYGDEFAELAEGGASPQRPLWGSTGTKDPTLSDVLYVEELVGPLTVNTIPMATLKALNHHGRVRRDSLREDLEGAKERFELLTKHGISLDAVCQELQVAGVKSFADSFDQLFATIQRALK